jgi:diguanylate cyclase (GGDEF)-like protein
MLKGLFNKPLNNTADSGGFSELDWLRERDLLSQAAMAATQELVAAHDTQTAAQSNIDEVFTRIATRLTQATPHLKLAWWWHGNGEEETVQPQAYAGLASDYARSLSLSRALLARMSPALRTLLGHNTDEALRAAALSAHAPWKLSHAQYGFAQALALPFATADGLRRGVVVFYAGLPDYFEQVGTEALHAVAQYCALLLQLAQIQQVLQAVANSDPLTSLLNRRGMQLRLTRAMAQVMADRQSAPKNTFVMLLNMDYFKQLNDYYGPSVGDKLLAEVAQVLSKSLRSQDVISRWGGDEFLIIIHQQTEEVARQVAERLKGVLSQHDFKVEGEEVQISASLGVAPFLDHYASQEAWVDAAQGALKRAKEQGRNRIAWV